MDDVQEVLQLLLLVCMLWEAKNWLDLMEDACSRRFWVNPAIRTRDEDGLFATSFEHIYTEDHEHFKVNVRMTPAVFDILYNNMRKGLTKNSNRPSISGKCRLFLTLTYLAHGESTRYLADIFKLGASTVRQIIQDTCELLWFSLVPTYMAAPNESEWRDIANDFSRKWNLPHCVGAMDGKLMMVNCPPSSRSRKTSLTLLGVCDANHAFTAVDLVDPGALWESDLGKRLRENSMDLPNDDVLENTNITFPYFFVADISFPLRNNIMKPYPGKLLQGDRATYNERVSRALQTIQNTFGVLVSRWKVLCSAINMSLPNAENVIKATVALHNFLKAHEPSYCPSDYTDCYDSEGGILTPGLWRQEPNPLQSVHKMASNNASKKSFVLRDIFKDYIAKPKDN